MELSRWRRSLPIFPAREKLLREIKRSPNCVVIGETGSGKTTQIPQYLLESGVGTSSGAIAVTQPRRVAAVTIARRVAEERGCRLGSEVGYAVRFDECYTSETRLKYMTDGMLLREAISDCTLSRYGTVILDEAHERTVHTDLLFGVVKAAQRKRRRKKKELKVVVMSATLAAEEFSDYFNKAKVLYVQGRQFPVQILYTAEPQQDYIHSVVVTVLQFHQKIEQGDILVFLTGREEIESVQRILNQCRALFPPDWQDIHVQPLYAALPSQHQQKVFRPAPQGCRKVILSTNIAETSVTIPGVRYVVDPGLVKLRGYSHEMGLDILSIQPVSQAQAYQRAGRAGREAPGSCYRLFTEPTFSELKENTDPEIIRCSLSSVVLELLAMGISDLLTFDFMTAPSEEGLVCALENLCVLGAVESGVGEGVTLTKLGKKMANFPLEPELSQAILLAHKRGCSVEVVTIVALLSVDTLFVSPPALHDQAAAAHMQFHSPYGDHVTLLSLYQAYTAASTKSWCRNNFIHQRNLRTALDVRQQLVDLCGRLNIPLLSNTDSCIVRQALMDGLRCQVAQHVGEGKYRTMSSRKEVFIHPSSCLFHMRPHPSYLLYSQLIHTTKCYMRNVSVVEADWLTILKS